MIGQETRSKVVHDIRIVPGQRPKLSFLPHV